MSSNKDIIFNKFLDLYFFNNWKKDDEKISGTLELIVSPHCNTKCSYCYYKNYGEELYCNTIAKTNNILENSKLLFEWVEENKLIIKKIYIFSGEFFNLPYYKEILEHCKKYFLNLGIKGSITIPTNSTFLFEKEKTEEIENLLDEFKKCNIGIHLSHSVDGKYLDNDTRKTKNGKEYNDSFYEELFKFAKKNNTGFHPMISAEGIKNWKKNYTWYIDNLISTFGSIDEALKRFYLLEVRNPDWKEEDLQHLEDFILFLVEDIFQKLGRDKEVFVKKIVERTSLNFFTAISSVTGRGISCSAQMDFGIRLGDLAIVPCHRTSYEGFNGGYFEVKNGKIVGITSENPETYIMYKTFDSNNSPVCQSCLIGHLCNRYCMGVNMEVNKDFYIPVETVCRMEFIKTKSIIKGFMNIGVLDDVIRFVGESSSTIFKKKGLSNVKYKKNA